MVNGQIKNLKIGNMKNMNNKKFECMLGFHEYTIPDKSNFGIKICKHCKKPYTPQPHEIRALGLSEDFLADSTFMKGEGCSVCGNSGYKGRFGVYEIFMLSEEIQHLIYDKKPASIIRDAAIKNGMRTLRDDAMRKAATGTTTLEEVIRLTVNDDE